MYSDLLGVLYRAHGAVEPQQVPQRLGSPAEAARNLIVYLSQLAMPGEAGPDGKVCAPDGAAAQAQLTFLIRQGREIRAQAETMAQHEAMAHAESMADEERSSPRQ